MKQLPANFQKETAGVLAIHSFANGRHWIWRPVGSPDTGIDGTLEVASPSGGVSGKQLGVQSKSGRSYIRSETAGTFQFYATADDVAYWEAHTLPVLLCVYDPIEKRLYAVSVKDYLRDFPDTRAAPHRFLFDKSLDRVAGKADVWIRDVAFSGTRSYRIRRPVTIQERIHTNLLVVRRPHPVVLSAAITKPFESSALPGTLLRPAFVQREQRCWSFADLRSDSSFDDHLDQGDIVTWSWEDLVQDTVRSSYLFELLYLTLRRHMRGLPIAFDRDRKRYYFLSDNSRKRTWDYRSQFRRAKRTVAAPIGDQGYWFHHSAKFTWQSLGSLMLLKVIPGYVFTHGGTAIKGDEDVIRLNVKKRKREYNKQVFQHLVFWREVLAKGNDSIAIDTGVDALTLDKDYISQDVPFGIYDDAGTFAQLTEPEDEAMDEADFEDEQELDGGHGSLRGDD